MKDFEIKSEGNYKPSRRGKGFPRHFYKSVAIDEDEAMSSTTQSSPRIEGMNRSYQNLAEWKSHPWLSDNHIRGWLRKRIGKNADEVFSEFQKAFSSFTKYRGSQYTPLEYFRDYVKYDAGPRSVHKYGNWDVEFIVDNQNRIQKNPEYKSWRYHPELKYSKEMVKENQDILDSVTETLQKTKSFNFIGPVKIAKPLWVVHPKTGEVVKAPVYLTRYDIYPSETPDSDRWDFLYARPTDTPGKDKVEWIRENWVPVSVILSQFGAGSVFKLEDPTIRSFVDSVYGGRKYYYKHRFLVPVSFL